MSKYLQTVFVILTKFPVQSQSCLTLPVNLKNIPFRFWDSARGFGIKYSGVNTYNSGNTYHYLTTTTDWASAMDLIWLDSGHLVDNSI